MNKPGVTINRFIFSKTRATADFVKRRSKLYNDTLVIKKHAVRSVLN